MKTNNKETKASVIFTDGSGCRPDGKGSAFAWLCPGNGKKQVTREDGLTNNQAEYRAILSAVEDLPPGTQAEIRTDSENTCCQLNGQRRVRDSELTKLHSAILDYIRKNRLSVTFTWVPRNENLAGKLI